MTLMSGISTIFSQRQNHIQILMIPRLLFLIASKWAGARAHPPYSVPFLKQRVTSFKHYWRKTYLRISLKKLCCAAAPHHKKKSHPWPLTLFAVCVDNFIAKSNRLTLHDLCHISRAMLYGIHLIFQPKSITKHCGHDPVSEKTLEKGEDTWEYLKEILVWLFDGEDFTIQLPKDKFDSIFRLLCCIMKLPKVSVR